MNKLQLAPFFIFYSLFRLDFVNRLNLVNKKGLTTMFTKSSLGCTLKMPMPNNVAETLRDAHKSVTTHNKILSHHPKRNQ